MNTVKDLQVNKKAKCLNKRVVLRLMVGVTIVGVMAAIPIGVTAHHNNVEEQQKTSIMQYYGEDSIESKIVNYIDISEELRLLNLGSFNIDESLYKKHNISDQLKSPEEIKEYITKFKNINSFVSSKDITKQSKNIDIVLNLAVQEKLVNSYIYNVGYSTANKNITDATKKYTAEVFGVENPANIYFNYHLEAKSGESSTKVMNRNSDEYGSSKNEVYNFDNQFQKKEEKNINKGIISMTQTDVSGDKIPEDNDRYNEDRNDNIREALANSVNLENQVEDYDLYNERMANKMK